MPGGNTNTMVRVLTRSTNRGVCFIVNEYQKRRQRL